MVWWRCLVAGTRSFSVMWERIKTFFIESRKELRHVNWPTRQEAVRLTAVVIVISLGIAVFLGLFDYVFAYALQSFIVH